MKISDYLFPTHRSNGGGLPRPTSFNRAFSNTDVNNNTVSNNPTSSPKSNGSHQFEMGKMFYGRALQAAVNALNASTTDDQSAVANAASTVDRHVATAIRWLTQAASQDHAEAYYYLALCHADFSSSPTADTTKILSCLESASKHGHSLASFTLSALYYYHHQQFSTDKKGVISQLDDSKENGKDLSYLHDAADYGNNIDAHYALGIRYLTDHLNKSNTNNSDKNLSLAAKYLTQAQQSGHKQLIALLESIVKAHSLSESLLQMVTSPGNSSMTINSNKKKQAEKEVNELIQQYLFTSSLNLISQCQAVNDLIILSQLKGIVGITFNEHCTLVNWLNQIENPLLVLGLVFYEGVGVTKSVEKAKYYFEQAVLQAQVQVQTVGNRDGNQQEQDSLLLSAYFALSTLIFNERVTSCQDVKAMIKLIDLLRCILDICHGISWDERYWNTNIVEWQSLYSSINSRSLTADFPKVIANSSLVIKSFQERSKSTKPSTSSVVVIPMRETKYKIDENIRNVILKQCTSYLKTLSDELADTAKSTDDLASTTKKQSRGRLLFTLGYCNERQWSLINKDFHRDENPFVSARMYYEEAASTSNDELAMLRLAIARLGSSTNSPSSTSLQLSLPGVESDVSVAIQQLEQLSTLHNNRLAQFMLGELYEYGLSGSASLTVNESTSKSFYQLAIKNGHIGAAHKLNKSVSQVKETEEIVVESPSLNQHVKEPLPSAKATKVEHKDKVAPVEVVNSATTENVQQPNKIVSVAYEIGNNEQSDVVVSVSDVVVEDSAVELPIQSNNGGLDAKQENTDIDEASALVSAGDITIQLENVAIPEFHEAAKAAETVTAIASTCATDELPTANQGESIQLAQSLLSLVESMNQSMGITPVASSMVTDFKTDDPLKLAVAIQTKADNLISLTADNSLSQKQNLMNEELILAQQILAKVNLMFMQSGHSEVAITSSPRGDVNPISLAKTILAETNALIELANTVGDVSMNSQSSIQLAQMILTKVIALTPNVTNNSGNCFDISGLDAMQLANSILAKTNGMIESSCK